MICKMSRPLQGLKHLVVHGNAAWVTRLPRLPGFEWGEDYEYLRHKVAKGVRIMGALFKHLLEDKDLNHSVRDSEN